MTKIDMLKVNITRNFDSQIVFIDSQVTNYQTLAASVVPHTKVVILDANRDGVSQISAVLQQESFTTIHIVSHGSPGCLYLGNAQLSLDTLNTYENELQTWFSPCSLLLYGCNVAAGDAGAELIAKLSKITKAEIAASTTVIGSTNKGGNWELEYQTTPFIPTLAFKPEIQQSYSEVFAVTSGTVFIDYDNDGTQEVANDASEIGYEGITVIAYDANENIIAQTTTDVSGNYSLTTPDGTPLRIEFGNLPEGFSVGSIAGGDSVSDILFIDGNTPNLTANLGINRPSDITTGSTANIDLVTACYVLGIGNSGDAGIVVSQYNNAGSPDSTNNSPNFTYSGYDPIATFQDVGTVYGLAHHRESNTVFTGSFYKRHSALLGIIDFINDGNTNATSNNENGIAYTSVIYTVSNDGTDTVQEFVRLDDVLDPRGVVNSSYDWDVDAAAFANVGKLGLGDIELSEDGQTLWTVNLNDNQLYQIPVGDSTDPLNPTPPSAEDLNSFDFITQIINDGGDLGINPQQNIRPFALSIRNGLVYIGMVNTAQFDANGNTGNTTAADLEAFVYTFDPDNPNAAPIQVLDIPLNYERDQVINLGSNSVLANWNPWTDTFPTDATAIDSGTFNEIAYAQPIFSDIDFDPDGNMILGFRDRWGDQLGYGVADPDETRNDFSSTSGGDILQAIYDDTTDTWTIETHVTTDGVNGNNDPDGEFFRNEFLEDNDNPNDSTSVHAETAQGGLTVVPGVSEVVTTAMDPVDTFSGGFEWFNTTDGSFAPGYQVTEEGSTVHGLEIFSSNSSQQETFGKANGLADLEFIAAAADVTIGNRVWFDANQDGIQSVGELDVPDGIEVQLYDSNGSLVDTATIVNGQYFFSGLEPLTNYEVRLAASDFESGADLEGYQATLHNIGGDRLDSDAVTQGGTGIPIISFTTGVSGTSNQTLDIGLINNVTVYDYGDAPDPTNTPSTGQGNYQTTQNDGGARHIISNGLTIGNSVDADDGTLQNTAATADTDDGVSFTETLETTDSSFSVNVEVNLATTFSASDDFDSGFNGGTGDWSTSEWTEVDNTAGLGESGGRVRVNNGIFELRGTNNNRSLSRTFDFSSATGAGLLTFNYSQINLDAGDAFLVRVSNGSFTETFTIDNSTSNSTTAGESASLPLPQSLLTASNSTTITIIGNDNGTNDNQERVYIDNINITAPGIAPATLVGWIDFDGDGEFENTEAVSQEVTTSGTQTLTWNSFPNITDGTTYARFRLSSDPNLNITDSNDNDSTVELSNGEVEDYQITIGRDYGDAPDTQINETGINPGEYSTTKADGGASHGILNGLSIGNIIDADSGSLQNEDADADDINGLDDEDGVTFTSTLSLANETYSVDVDVTNTTGTDALLTGWIDFDQSGTFDVDERISTIFSTSGTKNLTWTDLDTLGVQEGTTYARFRLSTEFSTTPTPVTTPVTTSVYREDFEGTVTGWVVDPKSGDADTSDDDTATSGVWEIDGSSAYSVNNTRMQLAPVSGSQALVTNGQGTVDVDGGFTTIRSETFPLNSGTGTHEISFFYFLSSFTSNITDEFTVDIVNAANDSDRENIFTDTINSGVTQAARWSKITEAINTSFNGKTVYLEFKAQDGGGDDTVEAGVDDILVTYTENVTATEQVPTPLDPNGALRDGEVEDYELNVGRDYGDAPDTTDGTGTGDYQTIADNGGASHTIVENLRIGSLIDADPNDLQNEAANADDIDGIDDEDGVTFLSNLKDGDTSYTTTVKVTNNTGNDAKLVAWIDFDQNGIFETTEAVIANVPTGNTDTDVTLTWDDSTSNDFINNLEGNGSLPTTIPTGITYARFRLTTDANFDGDNALGAASDGEVEDYRLTTNIDYGDARDTGIGTATSNYRTTADDNGASHIIDSRLTIGYTIDADNGTLQNGTATADDADGFVGRLNYEYYDFASAPTTVDDIPVSGAEAIGTLDPNGDLIVQADQGDTANFGIRYSGNIFIETPGTYTFYTTSNNGSTLSIDDTLVVDNSTGGTNSGTFTFGTSGYYAIEAEYIQASGSPNLTWEYQSTAAGIARTAIPASILSTDDEDGVVSFATLQTDDSSYSVDVVVTNTTGQEATLIGWIDFDQSGTFDADEFATIPVSNDTTPNDLGTTVTLNWTNLPTDITAGLTYARFRLSTDDNLTENFATNQLNDGEVEDYLIDIEGVDYGDAPDTEAGTDTGEYRTRQADQGASHIIVEGLKIGATVDAEIGTFQNTAADADDNDNNNDDDDEDGVTFPAAPLNSVTSTTYSVDVDFTNDTGKTAALVGWIDFDQSGTFDADEVAYELVNDSIFDQSTTLTWDSLPGITSGTTYSRFRLSTDIDTVYTEGFEGDVSDWTLDVAGDTADVADADSAEWEIESSSAYIANGTDLSQLSANTGTNLLVTDGAFPPSIAEITDVDGGFTTAQSPTFTLESGSGTHSLTFSYFFSSITSNATDLFRVEIVDANDTSNSAIIFTDTVASGTTQAAAWTEITRTIPNSFNGKNVYLEFIAQDGGGDDAVEAGVDDISVRYFLPTGALNSGEVEDYQIIVEGGEDYGDAAGINYQTTTASLDPTRHSIISGLSIGSSVDSETAPPITINTTATNDDNNGIDDEEGVTFTSPLQATNTSYSVTVDVTNTTGSDAELIGWIDFNDNGTFETGEASNTITVSTSGEVTLNWSSITVSSLDNTTYGRFRLNSDPATLSDNTATGALDGGEVEDYVINIVDVDYGDAPDTGTGTGVGNYQTTDDDNGASHIIVSGLTIGDDIDGDTGELANAGATADDTDDNPNDEDGVTSFNLLSPTSTDYSVEINVTNTSTTNGANLIGWIDFDRDGEFEASEASNIITGITSTNDGTQTLTWSNLDTLGDGIISGVSYARFRLTTDTLTAGSSIGEASDGEVEDYQVAIADVDYGDAPDTGAGRNAGNYETTDKSGTANDGASHIIVDGLYMGADNIDGDNGNLANTAATADNLDGVDDEDGVTEFDNLAANALTYSVEVAVTNTSATEGANLIGWIDFDGDGAFEASEASNIITGITSTNDGTQTLTWSNLENLTDGINSGTSYVRLRYSTDTLTSADSTGAASDGEVEDYQITIAEVDYGDAPDTGAGRSAGNYETTDKAGTANDGASHGIVAGISLGTLIDGDNGNLANTAATADDLDGVDDEEGIVSFDPLNINATSYSVDVDLTNTSTTGVNLIGWIDFDGDGEFEDAEASNIVTNIGNTDSDPNNATQTLTWTGIQDLDTLSGAIAAGTTYARFRLSTETLTTASSTGALKDGEVEDYSLSVSGGTDFGDIDTNNGTGDNYSSNSTSHNIVGGLSLGNSIDNEAAANANDTATGDDNNGIDDEEGVTFTSNLKLTDDTYSVTVDVTNTTGSDAELIGWIDFDGDGLFEPGEASSEVTVSSTGEQTLTWSGIQSLTSGAIAAGDTYARFRLNDNLTNLTTSTATGALDGGEVEDYQITIVELDYGDAAGYQTLATDTNPTRHAIVDGLRIGNLIDADDGTLADATARLDDLTNLDDENENGFIEAGTLATNSTSYTVDIDVTNTLADAATLVGWIDFNGNGTFEASEASDVISNITTSGTQALTWSNLATDPDAIVAGDTYARIRLSTDALTASDSTGEANDGEVEDYPITIADVDYGDAPDTGAGNSPGNYETTDKAGTVDDGPSHVVVIGLSLGTAIDGDNGNLANTDADADDTDENPNDEDGVASFEVVAADATTYTAEVNVTNTLGTAANLVGWIDFDGDGFFEGSEASDVLTNVTASGTQTLTWSNFNSVSGDVIVGTTYARIRLSTDALTVNSSNGAASDGEVEDYSLITVAEVDYGDAPDTGAGTGVGNYQTTNKAGTANDGASHIIIPGLYMGADNVDGDSGNLANTAADADDTTGVDDEDGVTTFDPLTTTTTSYSVTVNVTNTTGNNANLIGWIDFNGNGVFEETEASDAITGIDSTNDGNLVLNWSNVSSITSGVSAGDTYARIRLSNDTLTASSSTGALNSGEVEDYAVTIQAAGQDYGDAAKTGGDSYASSATNHNLVDGLRLGNAIDNDNPTPPTPNFTADADDQAGADDEDGVTFISNLTTTSDTYSVTVDVVNTVSANAELIGWIDFNQNGTFEPQEASDSLGTITSSGEQTLTWSGLDTLPGGISLGDTYARFRLNDNAANLTTSTPTGLLDGGEVEDYLISVCNEVTGYTYPESLTGTSDNDCITGLDGQDTLAGGAGNDVFVYTKTSDGIDTITDFEPNADKLDFRAIANNELSGVAVSTNLFDDGYVSATNFGTAGVMIQVDSNPGDTIFSKNVVLLQNTGGIDASDIDADDFMF